MKKLILGAVMGLIGIGGCSFGNAAIVAPVWGCKLKANLINSQMRVELLLARGETVNGTGTVVCRDALGQRKKQAVAVHIDSVGFGPAYNGNLEGLTIYAVRAGVSTDDGMSGQFQLQAGPRLGLINARAGLLGGAQIAGNSIGAGVEAVIESRFSIGIDVGEMVMTVKPLASLR